jgi:hypothetical protein
MSKNTIEASVSFSFKGEDYSYSSCIDLDQLLSLHDSLPSIHAVLARQHAIDTYSYLYEVMLEAEIEFASPEGYAADYMIDGEFDLNSLAYNWLTAKAMAQVIPIAQKELGIDDLRQHSALCRALVDAYLLGKKS